MATYPYRRYRVRDSPVTPLSKPISELRFALVTTGGLRGVDDPPFDRTDLAGDVSFREIGAATDLRALVEDHKSDAFDHAGVAADPNLVFPLDRFRELAGLGLIGGLGPRHLSFVGSIVNPRRLIEETAPAAARLLKSDGVDAVLLTPV